ncbi:hypothetical protein FQN54_004302 [Arachnomyces sp. PD_36]|nr:hypothetical protein FQN54_004302 [Arachnomyces sp. PD_36]
MAPKGILLALLALPFARGDASDYLVNAGCNGDQLFSWFNPDTGVFPTADGEVAWWTGANMLTAINNLALLDDGAKERYSSIWEATYYNAPGSNPHFKRRKRADGSLDKRDQGEGFFNSLYDDEAWWGLAWVGAYDNTGIQEYLDVAITLWNDLDAAYGKPNCGAVPWTKDEGAPALAIENELYIQLGAALANRASPDNSTYLDGALKGWDWFQNSGLINSDNLINDGLNPDTCENDGDPVFSYNQGVILGGLAELYIATGNTSYLDSAAAIADAVTGDGSPLLNEDGILVDECDISGDCSGDGVQFKGVFLRNLQKLYSVRQSDQWKDFIETNAQSIWENDLELVETGCANGVYWAGPYSEADASAQSSALDCLVAAVAVTG